MNLDDVLTVENGAEDEETYFSSVQKMINAGQWSFQGSMGRAMMDAISAGYCMLGRSDARDYWGNHIPSREQVRAGTKGSFDFVKEAHGEEWAEMISEIE